MLCGLNVSLDVGDHPVLLTIRRFQAFFPGARGKRVTPRSPYRRLVEGAVHLLFSEVQIDHRPERI
jgi:hypothetical protein